MQNELGWTIFPKCYRIPMHTALIDGEVPFNLTYDIDAMLLVEVGKPSPKRKIQDMDINTRARHYDRMEGRGNNTSRSMQMDGSTTI